MEEQAKLILKKCHGLTLAISTIGGFLATKPKTAVEWRKMHGRISAELEINPELRTIKKVLMRSYDGLPYHLKSCFLYMSIFPEDYIIKRRRLVRRWIEEGYCKEMHGMTAEEVGDTYFDELLERSMILPGEGVNHHSGKVYSCLLHDIIREICMSKAREENLVFTLEEGCCLSSTEGPIRHLVISSNWKRDEDVFDNMLDLSHVRSLTVYGEWKPYFISKKMRFLRVLDLDDTLRFRNNHLNGIGQFYHLRYLSIRNGTYIWYLPNSIGDLSHLQTLDIKGTNILELPTTITKLHKLQHIRTTCRYIPAANEREMFDSRLLERSVGCKLLVADRAELGLNMHDMFNVHRSLWVHLQNIGTQGVKAPRGTGKLTSLRTLCIVNVTRGHEKVMKDLSSLTQLCKLDVCFTFINKENMKKFWSAIAAHNQLRSLTVRGYDREAESIDGCLGGDLVPHWMHHLQSLSKLDLKRSRLNKADDIQTLGDLPNLTVLRLRYYAIVMDVLHFVGSSFPSLVVLELWVTYKLNHLRFEKDAMPKLELLQTDEYLDMKGLQLLTNLKEIQMDGEGINKMKMQLEDQYAEHPNLKNISLKLFS
ncbi:hypothetical protein VPH35_070143 [Triticum aestivum]